MSIRILSATELFPSSSDREGGFRGLDERFIALPVRQRSQGEGQSKSPCPCLPRSGRSEEHTSELQSQSNLVCRLLLVKKKKKKNKKKNKKKKKKKKKKKNNK